VSSCKKENKRNENEQTSCWLLCFEYNVLREENKTHCEEQCPGPSDCTMARACHRAGSSSIGGIGIGSSSICGIGIDGSSGIDSSSIGGIGSSSSS
jgi:hypothetical protein